MAKRKHQSFKLTPHSHPQERVLLYVLLAVAVGVVVGWLLQERFADILGLTSL